MANTQGAAAAGRIKRQRQASDPMPAPAHHTAGPAACAAGELTAYEPPWLVGYRLAAGPRTYLLRATCTTRDGGTQIHVHQASDGPPLTVDLYQLQQALAASAPAPGESSPDRTSEASRPARKET